MNLTPIDPESAWEMAIAHANMGMWEEAQMFLNNIPDRTIDDLKRIVLLEAL